LLAAGRGPWRVRSPADRIRRSHEQAALDRAPGDRRGEDRSGWRRGARDRVAGPRPADRGAHVTGNGAQALRGRRILLGVTGGIAAYKVAQVARLLSTAGADVRTILTEAATRFVGPDTFAALTGNPAHTSLFEQPGVVLHVSLAREADLAVVAPATANVIAKLAHGRADDLLTSTLLEARCPLLLAPAMHTGMWEHSATQQNVATLRARGRSEE